LPAFCPGTTILADQTRHSCVLTAAGSAIADFLLQNAKIKALSAPSGPAKDGARWGRM
jgi:hypothetical protein